MALPLRLRHREGEPAHGTMVRLAARHRDADVFRFAQSYGCPMRDLLAGRLVLRVGLMAGVDPERLAVHSPRLDVPRRVVTLAGEVLLLNDWSIRRRRWCPACLRDDRLDLSAPAGSSCWHRSAWDVGSVTSCPLHRIALAERCPECGSPQDWRGPSIDRCRCGGDLGDAMATSVSHGSGTASDYIGGRLGLGGRTRIPLLDGLALKDATVQLERLGECIILGRRMLKARRTRNRSDLSLDAGVAVALGWPLSFEAILDLVLADARQDKAPSGMIGTYGWIYSKWASRPLPDGFAVETRNVMAAHARRNSVVPADEPLFGELAHGVMTLKAAARSLGMGHASARRRLVAEGLAPGTIRRGVGVPLDEGSVHGLRARLSGEIGVADVGKCLGIAKAQTTRFLELGLLSAIGSTAATRRFLLADVETLLARLASGAPRLAGSVGELLCLPRACKVARVSVATACIAILGQKLTVLGILPGDGGLRCLLLRAADVRRLGSQVHMSVEAAASVMKVHPDVARHLLRCGILRRRLDGGHPAVLAQSVALFRARYVACTEFAAQIGASPRSAHALLAATGVDAAFGPPACRQFIFERRAIRASASRRTRHHRCRRERRRLADGV